MYKLPEPVLQIDLLENCEHVVTDETKLNEDQNNKLKICTARYNYSYNDIMCLQLLL